MALLLLAGVSYACVSHWMMLYHAAGVMGGGKTSRLYQRLVYKDKLVDDVEVDVTPFELASQFVLTADVTTASSGLIENRITAVMAMSMASTW